MLPLSFISKAKCTKEGGKGSLAVIECAIDKCQLASNFPLVDFLCSENMVFAERLSDVVASPYQDHMYHGASSHEKEHAEHREFITGIKVLPSNLPHHKSQSHESHCQPSKHPHYYQCLFSL